MNEAADKLATAIAELLVEARLECQHELADDLAAVLHKTLLGDIGVDVDQQTAHEVVSTFVSQVVIPAVPGGAS